MRSHASARRPRALHLPALLSVLLLALSATALVPTPVGARPAVAAVAAEDAVEALGRSVVVEAARHHGKPYRWGAAGPNAFDCSGFTLFVFGRFGRSLPHNAQAQYGVVRHVSQADRRPGDLIFSYDGSGQIHHVGIYAGGDTMWHAPRRGDVVRRDPLWTSRYRVGRLG